jgi:hypothetical protein
MATESPSFHTLFLQFCEDLKGTFPELSFSKCRSLTAEEAQAQFHALWKSHQEAIRTRDASIFTEEGIEVLPGVVLTKKLWKEVGDSTHTAIWNYLSSLTLILVSEGFGLWDEEEMKKSMEDMMKHLKEAAEAAGAGEGSTGGAGEGAFPFAGMGGIFEKLKEMAEKMGEGKEGGMPDFKIPERMFNGHIAKMAKELAAEFKPEDFGISPEMLQSDDPAKIFEYLQEIFTKKPDMLMSAAQRIAKKIQAKFQRGEIRREEIIAEVEELMKEFSGNEAFNSLFGQLGDILSFSAKATGNEGSERRRVVQERLRKKQAEKDAKKAKASPMANAAAIAAAEKAAAALLLEEEAAKKKGKKQ